MDCACDAAFSCFQSTVGLVLPFVLVDPPVAPATAGEPISNAESAVVTWINQQGLRRLLTLSYSPSAVFTYTLSQADTRSPHTETGYLEVKFGVNVYPTSSFILNVIPHF
jgi:hypothetical protein